MFTGIITKVSEVKKVSEKNGSLFLEVKKPSSWKIKSGDSISINGVCSTVRTCDAKKFEVEYMPETIKKTTVAELKVASLLNLERSLKLSDLLDGHLVQGHIDTRGKVLKIKKDNDSIILKVQVAKEFMKFIAPKGSVSIDGVSLTVVDVGINWFSVSLVSFTLEHTNMHAYTEGVGVNIETDVLAKYIYNFYKTSLNK